ncbi:MAG: hypothetical protein ABSC61_10085 [Anaerolineales bacterium]
MQTVPSMRVIPFFLPELLLFSCASSLYFVFPDQVRQEITATAPGSHPTAQSASEIPTGEPYLAATFPSGGKIFLFAPHADDVVATPWVDFKGTAPEETVISFDDEIAVAGQGGLFSARVPLEEGPNEIQCVASDLDGNEVDFSVIVVYDPAGS